MPQKLMLACPHGERMQAISPIVHHEGDLGYWVGVECRWPGWSDRRPHRHNLAPDRTDAERVVITDAPHYYATTSEAYKALDRWRSQP